MAATAAAEGPVVADDEFLPCSSIDAIAAAEEGIVPADGVVLVVGVPPPLPPVAELIVCKIALGFRV
jgi:hypothetical protein